MDRPAPLGGPDLLGVVTPALPVAQAIGRLGNWFNNALYGRPTELARALRVDPAHRHDVMADVATYHPTFLYEALWNLVLAVGDIHTAVVVCRPTA